MVQVRGVRRGVLGQVRSWAPGPGVGRQGNRCFLPGESGGGGLVVELRNSLSYRCLSFCLRSQTIRGVRRGG